MTKVEVTDVRQWQSVASNAFVPLTCTTSGRHFTASLQAITLSPGISIARIRSGPLRVERGEDLVRRCEHDDLLLSLQLHSTGTVVQHGRTAQLSPGSAAIYETNQPYILDQPHAGQDALVLRVARHHLDLDSKLLSHLCGRTIDPSVPGMSAFAGYLHGLAAENALVSAPLRGDLAHLSANLLAITLRSFAGGHPTAWDSDKILLDNIKSHIRMNLSDPELSVERLAAAHHISVRKLHSVFSDHGSTPGAYLRRARLEQAAKLLAARPATGQTVVGIAYNCGFRDASTFTRAFTRAYGCPPVCWAPGRPGPVLEATTAPPAAPTA